MKLHDNRMILFSMKLYLYTNVELFSFRTTVLSFEDPTRNIQSLSAICFMAYENIKCQIVSFLDWNANYN